MSACVCLLPIHVHCVHLLNVCWNVRSHGGKWEVLTCLTKSTHYMTPKYILQFKSTHSQGIKFWCHTGYFIYVPFFLRNCTMYKHRIIQSNLKTVYLKRIDFIKLKCQNNLHLNFKDIWQKGRRIKGCIFSENVKVQTMYIALNMFKT